jgi:DeoR family transcriptional regulator of aga operon
MLQLIRDHDFARVTELSDAFGVSEVTVRSDLDHLERRGTVLRVHGGAIPHLRPIRRERSFEEEAAASVAEKAAIGRAAAAHCHDGNTVILDVGTTTAAVARALLERQDLERLTVITNGLNIALQLEAATPRFTIIVTGGTLRPLQHSLVNPLAEGVLDQIHADVMFLGCNGVHVEAGVSNINLPEAEMKRRMMQSARRTIAVADSSKLGERSVARICHIDEIDRLVTGAAARPEVIRELEETGLEIDMA